MGQTAVSAIKVSSVPLLRNSSLGMNLKQLLIRILKLNVEFFFSCRGMSNILEPGEDLGISPTIFANRILSLNGPTGEVAT